MKEAATKYILCSVVYIAYMVEENFGTTMHVKVIGEEKKLANKLQSVHMPNTFSMYL